MGPEGRGAEGLGRFGQARIEVLYRADQDQDRERYRIVKQARDDDEIDIAPTVRIHAKGGHDRTEYSGGPEGQLDRIDPNQGAEEHQPDDGGDRRLSHPGSSLPDDAVGNRKGEDDGEDRGPE